MAIGALVGRLGRVFSRFSQDVLSTGIGFAAADTLSPPMEDLKAAAWRQFPNRRLTPDQLAELVVRGELAQDQAAAEARESGVNPQRFERMVKTHGNALGVGELIELFRRGKIDRARLEHGIRTGRIRTEWLDAILSLAEVLLSPEAIGGMAARGIITDADAAAYMRRLGLSDQDAKRSIESHRSVPAIGELLDLLNRGHIGDGDVTFALDRAGIEKRYRAPLLELRRRLPPLSDLVRFAVREVYTPSIRSRFQLDEGFPERFADEAAQQGFAREDAANVWAAHWELPSPQQGFAMLHRGVIGDADLDLLLRALDVMPFWRDKLKSIAFLVPGRIDLRRMYREGVIDRARVLKGYRDLGYNPQDAETLTRFADQESMADERSLAKAEVTALYQARTVDRSTAEELLAELGYDGPQAELLLALADVRRGRSFRNASVAAVRRRYLDREISVEEATGQLDRRGVPQEEREDLLDLWTFELDENPRRLTEAQARTAWKRGVRDEAWYRGYLTAQLGYPEEEADVLVAINAPSAEG